MKLISLEDDVVLDSSDVSPASAAAGDVWPSSNGGAHHYDVASAWMDNDAATEELHRYSLFIFTFDRVFVSRMLYKKNYFERDLFCFGGKKSFLFVGFYATRSKSIEAFGNCLGPYCRTLRRSSSQGKI